MMEESGPQNRLPQADAARLVQEICSGNEDAFKEFFFAMQPGVFRFLYRHTRNRQVAEDLTQESFLKFWEARGRIDPARAPASYLFRIARNLSLNHALRNAPERGLARADDEALIRYSQDPEAEYERRLAADEVMLALSYLPERSRAAFILSRYHDMTYEEIAETMRISLQTVKNQISKALMILRKRLCADDES